MGGLCSDLKGGQQGIGNSLTTAFASNQSGAGVNAGGGPNDAVDNFFRSRGVPTLYSQIELSISASKLRDMDILSKTDPMVVAYVKKSDGQLEEIGCTEVTIDTLNPIWVQKVSIAYQFEIVQSLVFRVFDVDTKYHNIPVKSLKLNEQDFLGEANCVLSEIVTKHNKSLTLHIQGKNAHGGKETVVSRLAVDMTFHCSKLENKDHFSKSDPFLRISKIVESGGYFPICKTEKSVADLEMICQSKTGANFHVLKSKLHVQMYREKRQYTFLDYISSGFELNFMVAIDFTASNGNPHYPDSLHYIDPSGRFNSYQQAIHEVGGVIQFYDTDKSFPTWGFGGKLATGGVSHCFNLNGSPNMSEVEGVNGILAAYSSVLQTVTLAGPTIFGPVINTAAQIAGQSLALNQNKYCLVNNYETKNALVRASDLPLPILIVGVGGADFKQMEVLDGDNGKLLESDTGRVATRDIVQFVPMRDVQGGQISVVQALLEELPSQFLTYMCSRDIKPCFVDRTVIASNPTSSQTY
ncbi:hypothetical protein MKX01_013696 [Papaver californicum]|nr:hypothetical protein MKX01_013696 [Papaver californicum]